jgi:hypothetical protein
MTGPETAAVRCAGCGRRVKVCAGCEQPGCRNPICDACLRLRLGQSIAQPHPHGG